MKTKNIFFSNFSFVKNSSIILLLVLAVSNSIYAQSFLKTYSDQQNPTAPVSFEVITPTTDVTGNFYVGGHVGYSIALFKMDPSGNILTTSLIPNAASGSRLDAIIYDNNYDVVVVGNYETSTTIQGFVFKFLSTGTVAWFTNTNASDLIAFTDVALIPNSSNYRISGSNGLFSYIHALVMDVIGASGVLTPTPFTNFQVKGVEEGTALQIANSTVYLTGRYEMGSGYTTYRQGLSRFDLTGLHLGSKYYLIDKTNTARFYSTDMIMSKKDGAICGWGDDDGTNVYENLTVLKVKASNGKMIWAKKYDDLTQSYDGMFSSIRYDNGVKNYVLMGYTAIFDYYYQTTTLDQAFIVYMDSSGAVSWANKYPFYFHPTLISSNHQYNLLVSGGYIFAIGQKPNSSNIEEGTLLKVSTSNGQLNDNTGVGCYNPLTFTITPYTFSAKAKPAFLTPSFPSTSFAATLNKDSLAAEQICGSNCVNDTIDLGDLVLCKGGSVTVCNQVYNTPGYYNVVCTGSDGCQHTYHFYLYNSTLAANAGPDGTVAGCCNTILNGSATGGMPSYTYSWSPTAGLSNPNIANPTCSLTGTYTLTVTDASGCTSTDVVVITAAQFTCCRVGQKDHNTSQALVFPNPSSNNFTLKTASDPVARLLIYNMMGNLVEIKEGFNGDIQFGDELTTGNYTLQIIYTSGKTEIQQLQKVAMK